MPEEYFDSSTATEICQFLENGRADTMKEAINLYESVQHEKRLEDMQLEPMIATKEAAKAQREAANTLKEQSADIAAQTQYAKKSD